MKHMLTYSILAYVYPREMKMATTIST